MKSIIDVSAQKISDRFNHLVYGNLYVHESSCSFSGFPRAFTGKSILGLYEQESHKWTDLLDVKVEICRIQTGGFLFKRMRDAVRFITPTENFTFIIDQDTAVSVVDAVKKRQEEIRQDKAEKERKRALETRKALMLVPDPCASFVRMLGLNGYSPNPNMLILKENEVCCGQYPSASVRITSANGCSVVVKNNLPYLQQLKKYGSGAPNVIYALPNLFNELCVSPGDTVYIESW